MRALPVQQLMMVKKKKREKLLRRLKQLYVLEFLNIFFLPLVFWYMGHQSGQEFGPNSIVAMILNGILLFEGSYLWFCISRQLRGVRQHDFIQSFKVLKVVNYVLFAFAVIAIIFIPFSGTFDKIVTTFFFVLAVLEQINYFEVQLMYDNGEDLQYLRRHKRLKVATLKRLMQERDSD